MNPRKTVWALTIGTAGALLLLLAHKGSAAGISAIWANSGEDKVTQDELRVSRGSANVTNHAWDGKKISIFGARNEVVSFNLILEAASGASNVSVAFNSLVGPSEATIHSVAATGNDLFRWAERPIELFYVRYLQIKGLSTFPYETYDERAIPKRMRRPWSGDGLGRGTWQDRPDHDKFYPDIAVPMELVPTFTIAAGQNQSVWADIYIPKNTPPGVYHGEVAVREGGAVQNIPVELAVYNFTLPDAPTAKTMLYYSAGNINRRYIGMDSVNQNSADGVKSKLLRDRHFLMAHRHRISLIGQDVSDCGSSSDSPCPEWVARLDGSLFTPANGYDGPGVNVGNNVFSIGTYGTWGWQNDGEAAMHRHTDAWETWFSQNAPTTERFLYLADEISDTAKLENWSRSILSNTGPGRQLRSFATIPLTMAASSVPSLDIPCSTLGVGVPSQWQPLADRYSNDARKRFYMYNGHRIASGSFAIEDEGIALRQLAWTHYKKRINRWFMWESTYYNNYQGNTSQTNVFQTAHTFGDNALTDSVKGQAGYNYSNGEGVLFYPGTDLMFPANSYGVDGPFASLRLKHWRRGLQDVEYLALAETVDPGAVKALIEKLIPKVLWEYGVADQNDPTWVRADISWPTDPDQWDVAREQLAKLAAGANPFSPTSPPSIVGNEVGLAAPSPSPWRKDRHTGLPVTFSQLPPNSTIKIFNVSGNLVKTITAPAGGNAPWDLTTESGDAAASGIYLYVISANGQNKRGKFGVIR